MVIDGSLKLENKTNLFYKEGIFVALLELINILRQRFPI
jgi:hypothetical protein